MPSVSLADLEDNLAQVDRLFEIHREVGGQERGRRHQGLEVLNKSAVVLTCACWEAFIEDLCLEAVDHLTKEVKTPEAIPQSLRASCFKRLEIREAGDFWKIAVANWKKIVKDNAESRAHGRKGDYGFTTPSAENVKELFRHTIGLRDATENWKWQKQSRASSVNKLKELIRLRSKIVHRVETPDSVHLHDAKKQRQFIGNLGEATDESVRRYLENTTNTSPWEK